AIEDQTLAARAQRRRSERRSGDRCRPPSYLSLRLLLVGSGAPRRERTQDIGQCDSDPRGQATSAGEQALPSRHQAGLPAREAPRGARQGCLPFRISSRTRSADELPTAAVLSAKTTKDCFGT